MFYGCWDIIIFFGVYVFVIIMFFGINFFERKFFILYFMFYFVIVFRDILELFKRRENFFILFWLLVLKIVDIFYS